MSGFSWIQGEGKKNSHQKPHHSCLHPSYCCNYSPRSNHYVRAWIRHRVVVIRTKSFTVRPSLALIMHRSTDILRQETLAGTLSACVSPVESVYRHLGFFNLMALTAPISSNCKDMPSAGALSGRRVQSWRLQLWNFSGCLPNWGFKIREGKKERGRKKTKRTDDKNMVDKLFSELGHPSDDGADAIGSPNQRSAVASEGMRHIPRTQRRLCSG